MGSKVDCWIWTDVKAAELSTVTGISLVYMMIAAEKRDKGQGTDVSAELLINSNKIMMLAARIPDEYRTVGVARGSLTQMKHNEIHTSASTQGGTYRW
jgi:hypothetical protein